MAKRSVGKLSKRTRLLRRKNRERTSIGSMLKAFKTGDKVAVDPKSRFSGMPHPRFRGMSGTVVDKRGNAYVVKVKVGGMVKTLVVPPVHLR